MKLGILPDLIEPASPQQNGRHERMHRTLKAETTIPPAGNRSAQQRRFNEFCTYFNDLRLMSPSTTRPRPPSTWPRPEPSKLSSPDTRCTSRSEKCRATAGIRWHSVWINVSHLLGGECIGLEEIAPGVWAVFFGPVSLGWLHIDKEAILDHDGSASRNPRR